MALGTWRFYFVLSLMFLGSACVDITINNSSGTPDASTTSSGTTSSGGDGQAVPGADPAPKATKTITLRGNLDETAVAVPWSPADPDGTANFSTLVTVYDSLGDAIPLDIYFCKTDAASAQPGDSGDWTYHIMTDGGDLTGGTFGTSTEFAAGALRFDQNGALISNTITMNDFNPRNATNPQPLTFYFGAGTATGGNGIDGLTQYAATSSPTSWANRLLPTRRPGNSPPIQSIPVCVRGSRGQS